MKFFLFQNLIHVRNFLEILKIIKTMNNEFFRINQATF